MAGEVIFAKLSQLEAFGTKVVTDFAALTARVQSLEEPEDSRTSSRRSW